MGCIPIKKRFNEFHAQIEMEHTPHCHSFQFSSIFQLMDTPDNNSANEWNHSTSTFGQLSQRRGGILSPRLERLTAAETTRLDHTKKESEQALKRFTTPELGSL